MRFLKLLAAFVLMTSMLGLAACTGGDLSGTAGDIPEPEGVDDPAPKEDPNPDPKEDPDPAPKEGADEPGGSTVGGGGDTTAPGGGDTTAPGEGDTGVEMSLTSYLAENSSARVDMAQIEDDCPKCLPDAEKLFEDLTALCASDKEACIAEYSVFLTKERTTSQVRNQQNLVGFPTGQQLLDVIEKDGAPPVTEGGDDGSGAGSEEPKEAPEGAEEPKAGAELPSGDAIAAVSNIVGGLAGTGVTELSWTDIGKAAAVAPGGADAVGAIGSAFAAAASGELEIPGCDAGCMATLTGLLDGDSKGVAEITELLEKFAAAVK